MLLQPRPVPLTVQYDTPMDEFGHCYYWEVKVSNVKYRYSSEGWLGVCTGSMSQEDATKLIQNGSSKPNFWGYGSQGTLSHNNQTKAYGPHFHEGDLIGAHVDLFHGTLEFHRNRKPLGIAYIGLPTNIPLYPVLIGATAVPTPSKIDGPHAYEMSLQLLSYRNLAKFMSQEDILKMTPPGLLNLVRSYQFLHYFTGESPNPKLHTRDFEMVIDSDDENCTENRVRNNHRRRRRRAALPQSVQVANTNTATVITPSSSCTTRRLCQAPIPKSSKNETVPTKTKNTKSFKNTNVRLSKSDSIISTTPIKSSSKEPSNSRTIFLPVSTIFSPKQPRKSSRVPKKAKSCGCAC